MGCQDDFKFAQDFASHTGIGPDSEVTLLWEDGCNAWQLNNIRTNSAMQLLAYDLSLPSKQVIFFNDAGRAAAIEASTNPAWTP